MKKQLKSQKGNVLAYVIMVMVVLFIIIGAVASLAQANIRQASVQEQGMQAYYLARSGAEVAYEVLTTTSSPNSLLTQFESDITNSIVLTSAPIPFDNGTADVKATSIGSGAKQKIKITSVGTLTEGNLSRTVTLEFYRDYTAYPEVVWSH